MRLGGHFGPPQYTTISALLGKFVLRISFPILSRGTRREPGIVSPLTTCRPGRPELSDSPAVPEVGGVPGSVFTDTSVALGVVTSAPFHTHTTACRYNDKLAKKF